MVADNEEIDVSFVMTVYNKEFYLPAVLDALLNQSGLKNPEFIFIDDVSKDKSVEIIRERTKGIKNVTLVAKEKNEGISITINQGIMRARGKWIRMLDSDDMLPLDSTAKMIELADKHNADIVYGLFKKTGLEPEELTKELMAKDYDYDYKENTLTAVLNGRFTRMGQLIKREVLQYAGGADERVFIQDESIPLRASIYSKGIIKMFTEVVLVPRETNNLSKNTNQLDNDRFFAHYYFLLDNMKIMDDVSIAKVYEKTLSANWKYVKKNLKFAYLRPDFMHYLMAKIFKLKPNFKLLEKYAQRFQTLTNVLRSKK